ncbi:hypothetical protein DERP_011115 [Dermatophagoides pteronyssinus]|uniref:Uncharacterized protein n=2 Tax=Dermatophagoides pteronyssinus TaxID=6956 RepID=A0ABQ8J9F1_DERPT|nr:uncharacterized protein LOC113794825 isoform X1 [Dermatophagoides pteronyssinus]KAH9419020.1 hypothetical protein DERP_011115 [Dermatophagoides pteronyssinus]
MIKVSLLLLMVTISIISTSGLLQHRIRKRSIMNEFCQQTTLDNIFVLDTIEYYQHIEHFWYSIYNIGGDHRKDHNDNDNHIDNEHTDDDYEYFNHSSPLPDSRIRQLYYGSLGRSTFHSNDNIKGFSGFMFFENMGQIFLHGEFVLISRSLINGQFDYIIGHKDLKTGHYHVDFRSNDQNQNQTQKQQNLAIFMQWLLPNPKLTTDLTMYLDSQAKSLYVIMVASKDYSMNTKTSFIISIYDLNKPSVGDIVGSKKNYPGFEDTKTIIGNFYEIENNDKKLKFLTLETDLTYATYDKQGEFILPRDRYKTISDVMVSLFKCGTKHHDKHVNKSKSSSSSTITSAELNHYSYYINFFLGAVNFTLLLTACMIPYFSRARRKKQQPHYPVQTY